MKKIYLLFIFICSCILLNAQTKQQADDAYAKKNYVEAIKGYENLLKENGESSVIYYNLGNSYFKVNNLAKSILNYERALQLNPGDNDTQANLDFVKSKTVDKINPVSKMFFITWIESLINSASERGWSSIGIITFIIALLMISLYLFGKKMIIRKIGFMTAIFMIVVCIITNVFAYQKKSDLINHEYAIIMAPNVSVKSTPNQDGTELFVLHEGSKVQIKDGTMKSWKEIRLEDGNVGWIPTSSIEII